MHEEKQHHEGHVNHENHATHAHHAKKSDVIKINKRSAMILGGLVLLGGLVYGGMYCLVAATVNGIPITRFAVMHGLERSNGKAYLESLVSERLINDAAVARGIVVNDADIMLEMKNIEAGLVAQGANMDTLLAQQGMTRDTLKKQMTMRKKVELLLGDKVSVSPPEVDQYITQSGVKLEAGKEAENRATIMEQLKGQKLQKEAGSFIEELRASANVRFFGFYKAVPALTPAPQAPTE